ncbi:MAG: FkbM family methyltransferase [Candidatus Nomurabacteria bacterium]|nr:MAG: FkbM family methyltransferase [Candidatus Nomurabacteria bacterium]
MKKIKLLFILAWRNLRWTFIKAIHLNGQISVQVYGKKIVLYLNRVGLDIKENNIFKQLALDHNREAEASKVMLDFIEPGDEIFEAGANIGYYVLLEASRLQGQGKIYAIEPDPSNYELLKKNVELNELQNYVDVRKLSVSDKVGHSEFFLSKDSNLHSFLPSENDEERTSIMVETTTIDAFLADKPKVNFIRMDIEGYECRVIYGMKQFLAKPGPLKLFIELHPKLVSREEMLNLLTILEESGFTIHKAISRDNYLRKQLGQTTVEEMTMAELKSDPRLLEEKRSFEMFFIKK